MWKWYKDCLVLNDDPDYTVENDVYKKRWHGFAGMYVEVFLTVQDAKDWVEAMYEKENKE